MTMVNKLDTIQKIKQLALKKASLIKQKDRMANNRQLVNPLTITFEIKTDDYKHVGTTAQIQFTPSNMMNYINAEIKKINETANELTYTLMQSIEGGN